MFFLFENVYSKVLIDSFGQKVLEMANSGLGSLTEPAIFALKLVPCLDKPLIGYLTSDLTKIC